MNKSASVKRSGPFLLFIVFLLVAADQVTKYLAVTYLKGRDSFSLIPGVLEFRYLENNGAAFGILQNSRFFFVIVALCAILGISFLYLRIPYHKTSDGKSYLPLRICCLLLVSGAAGNLIDRLQLVYVRDFIYFSLIDFPIFNVADIYVTVSVFILVFLLLFYYREEDLPFSDRRTA